jgi:hypothetical protein
MPPTFGTLQLADVLTAILELLRETERKHPGNAWARSTVEHQHEKLLRHLERWEAGERIDHEGQPTSLHVATRAVMLAALELRSRGR